LAAIAPTRATALASALHDFRGWQLLAHCPRCRVMRQIPVNRLAGQVGDGMLLRDVLPRLRCHRCGEPPRAVKLSSAPPPAVASTSILQFRQSYPETLSSNQDEQIRGRGAAMRL
jgi:hypothetical protein